jgi:hypothetical protein
MFDTTSKYDELRNKIGSIKIAKNNHTELFYTLGGHDEFETIMQLIKQYGIQERIDEHHVIIGLTDQSHEYEQNENGSGIQFFDDLRLERMNELTALKDKEIK